MRGGGKEDEKKRLFSKDKADTLGRTREALPHGGANRRESVLRLEREADAAQRKVETSIGEEGVF